MKKLLKVLIVFSLMIVVGCSHVSSYPKVTKVKKDFLMDSQEFLRQYGKKVIERKNNNDKATSHFLKGMNYIQNHNYNLAKQELKKALDISLNTVGKFNSKTAFFYNVLADISTKQKDYLSSIKYLEELLLIFKNQKVDDIGLRRRIGNRYKNIASVFAEEEKYNKTIYFYKKALEYFDKRSNEPLELSLMNLDEEAKKIDGYKYLRDVAIYATLSKSFIKQKKYKVSFKLIQKVEESMQKFNTSKYGVIKQEILAGIYFSTAQMYSRGSKEYKRSLPYYEKAKKHLNRKGEKVFYRELIYVYKELIKKNFQLSNNFKESSWSSLSKKISSINKTYKKAYSYYQKNDYEKSLKSIEVVIRELNKLKEVENTIQLYKLLTYAYELKGDIYQKNSIIKASDYYKKAYFASKNMTNGTPIALTSNEHYTTKNYYQEDYQKAYIHADELFTDLLNETLNKKDKKTLDRMIEKFSRIRTANIPNGSSYLNEISQI